MALNDEELNVELLAFVSYLQSRNLTICMWSKVLNTFTHLNCDQSDLVASYLNVKTGGRRP
jgi:hypothetical protein